MCGIMAYIGKKQAYPILLDGLKKLEYRGYDSSGVAIMNGSLSLLKKEGKVEALEAFAIDKKTEGNIGLGHTRWATHGVPSDINAHPHQSQSGRLTIVHNGIIENHDSLKEMLIGNGFVFQSDTDTEVLVQLIEWFQVKYKVSTRSALARALEIVDGSFAVVLFDLYEPKKLWAARRQSPLVLGVGNGECLIASDTMPIASYLDKVIYVESDLIIEMNDEGDYTFFDLELKEVKQLIHMITDKSFVADKGNFDSYMLKEIYEQPHTVANLVADKSELNLDFDIDRIIITACGTSWHSALIAEYLIEKFARVNVEVEYASEFRYRYPVLSNRDLVIGISQSGETADTIAALEMTIAAGCHTMAFVNVENSTIDRIVDQSIYLKAGTEIGVASTKAFTNQLTAINYLVAQLILKSETAVNCDFNNTKLESLIRETLEKTDIANVAEMIALSKNALFLGRGTMYPVALEGALKLKEISYIHAEGYPAGEMKHGPIALIDEAMPVIALCPNDEHLPKTLSNIQEVKARKGKVIIVKTTDVELPEGLADYTIDVPVCTEAEAPIIMNIPLQLLAYQVATNLSLDVDKPRNLAKSVTVE